MTVSGTTSLHVLGQASSVPGAGLSSARPARVCREAGATVALNVRLRDLNVDVARQDERRIEVIANGLALWGGSQLAVDTDHDVVAVVAQCRVQTAYGLPSDCPGCKLMEGEVARSATQEIYDQVLRKELGRTAEPQQEEQQQPTAPNGKPGKPRERSSVSGGQRTSRQQDRDPSSRPATAQSKSSSKASRSVQEKSRWVAPDFASVATLSLTAQLLSHDALTERAFAEHPSRQSIGLSEAVVRDVVSVTVRDIVGIFESLLDRLLIEKKMDRPSGLAGISF
eukprot:s7483_g1.t1